MEGVEEGEEEELMEEDLGKISTTRSQFQGFVPSKVSASHLALVWCFTLARAHTCMRGHTCTRAHARKHVHTCMRVHPASKSMDSQGERQGC